MSPPSAYLFPRMLFVWLRGYRIGTEAGFELRLDTPYLNKCCGSMEDGVFTDKPWTWRITWRNGRRHDMQMSRGPRRRCSPGLIIVPIFRISRSETLSIAPLKAAALRSSMMLHLSVLYLDLFKLKSARFVEQAARLLRWAEQGTN
jgi:hypothetical protein